MRKMFKIVGVNFALFIFLVGSVNLMSVVLTQLNYTHYANKDDKQYLLPAFDDKEEARIILQEFYQMHAAYTPFSAWKRVPFSGIYTHVGKDGLRQNSVTNNNKASKRIAFFGGSTLWGTGVKDNETISSFFDRISAQYVAINYGETGYNSRQNLARLINNINENKPMDAIVFYDGFNDIRILCETNSLTNTHEQEEKYRFYLNERDSANLWLGLVEPTISFLRRVQFTLNDRSIYDCSSNQQKAEKVADVLLQNWTLAHSVSQSKGIPFYAILQPVAYIGLARTDYMELPFELGKQFKTVYPILREKIKERRVPWIRDYSGIFDQTTEAYYFDYCHLNAKGNLKIASRMWNDLGMADSK